MAFAMIDSTISNDTPSSIFVNNIPDGTNNIQITELTLILIFGFSPLRWIFYKNCVESKTLAEIKFHNY